MKIQMICVGKIKETYLRELIDHYTKIIRKKYNFEIIELPDEKTPDNASDKEESKIKEIEGQRILDKIPEGSFVIPLCIKGTPYSTEQFQKKMGSVEQGVHKQYHIYYWWFPRIITKGCIQRKIKIKFQ